MLIKSQSLSYDFFVALTIFFIALILVFVFWKVRVENYEEYLKRRNMENFLLEASEIWFKEGYPIYWDLNNLMEIGLSNNGEVNSTKLEFLNRLSYYEFLSLIGSPAYNLKYEVFDRKGNLIYEYPEIKVEGKNVLFLDRYVIWNKSLVKVRSIVWD